MPTCRTCKSEKPVEEFSTRRPPRRHSSRCHSCTRAYSRAWYERNKERHRRNSAEWKLANPDRRRANNANYRARKQLATLQLSPEHIRQVQEIYQRAWFLSRKTGVPHQVDHLIPLTHPLVCGLHVPWNMQVIPAKTNIKKRNELMLDSVSTNGTPYTC